MDGFSFNLSPVSEQRDVWAHEYLLIYWFTFHSAQLKIFKEKLGMNIPAEYLTCTGVYLKMLLSSYLASPTPTGKNAGQRSLLGRREVQC